MFVTSFDFLGGCGWLRVVVDSSRWFWMVVGGFGWLHTLAKEHAQVLVKFI